MQTNKTIYDVLNAGIALLRAESGTPTLDKAIKEVNRTFGELREKVSSGGSEETVRMEGLLDAVVRRVNEIGRPDDPVRASYLELSKQIEAILPVDAHADLSKAIQDLQHLASSSGAHGEPTQDEPPELDQKEKKGS